MTDSQKRIYVSNLYSGPKWKKRVEKMRDDQITAIYLGHLRDGSVPHHDEGDPYSEESVTEPRIEKLEDEPTFVLGNHLTPQGPHANEDDFPIY